MALATGVEAPSSAVAQLGQLDRPSQVHFGRVTLWLTLAIVAWLTLGLTAVAVRLGIGIPPPHSTQIAEVANAATGGGALFGAFQLTSAVLLLAAASSTFQAAPGLLKALSRARGGVGILPAGYRDRWACSLEKSSPPTCRACAAARWRGRRPRPGRQH
jgi:hypothetical protein